MIKYNFKPRNQLKLKWTGRSSIEKKERKKQVAEEVHNLQKKFLSTLSKKRMKCACVLVCVCEREREREGGLEKEKERGAKEEGESK